MYMRYWVRVMIIIATLVGVSHSVSAAPELRRDLYRKIKKETSISLLEALRVIVGVDRVGLANLLFFIKKSNGRELDQIFAEEVSRLTQQCENSRRKNSKLAFSGDCQEPIEDVKRMRDHVKDMAERYDKLDGATRVYYGLLIYSTTIRTRVLKPASDAWVQNCGGSEKINSVTCNDKLQQLHALNEITGKIVFLAQAKAQRQAVDSEYVSELKKRLAAYEQP